MSCPPLTNKGGKLSISRFPVPCELTLPELAMLDYVVVPGVGSIGDTGIEQEISSYSTSNAGLSPQSKGAAVGKAWDVEMLESQSEARDILEAASAAGNKDTYATRIEWPDGVVEFSIVQVSSPTYVKGAPSGVRIVRYTMVPSFVPIVKNPLQAPVLYAPMYDAPDTVELNWFDLSSIEDGVHVYASYSKIDASALPPPTATLAPNTVQYDYTFDMGEVLEERLYFRVAAFNSDAVKVSNEQSIGNPANVLYPDSPTWLFGGGESGYANTLGLDTLFTDTSGTTPVEEYGDTIAMAGNLATEGPDMVQSTAPARPTYGRMPITRVKNLLAQGTGFNSETFSGFTLNRVTFGTSDGSLMRLTEDDTDGNHFINPSTFMRVTSGVTYTAFVIAKPGNVPWFQLAGTNSGFVDNQNFGNFNVATGTVGNKGSASTTFMALCPPELVADYPEFSGAYICALQLTADESNNAGFQIYLTNNQNFLTRAPSYLGTNGNNILLTRMMIAEGARDADWFVANYQKVVSAYDVTEEGVPSVDIAYLDSADDAFEWNLAAGTYYLFVAGEKGCYFDTVVHAGGEFTVGPTTWTGGPADAVTNLIGQRYVLVPEYRKDEPFTQFEREQLVAYAMARGCPGVWERGSNVFVPPITASASWTDNGDGSYTHVAPDIGLLYGQGTSAIGAVWVYDFTVTGWTSGYVRAEPGDPGSGGLSRAGNATFADVVMSTASGSVPRFYASGSFDGTLSGISIAKLTLNTSP